MVQLGGLSIFKKSDTEFVIYFVYNSRNYEPRGQLFIKKSDESDADCIFRGITDISKSVLKTESEDKESVFFNISNFFNKLKRRK